MSSKRHNIMVCMHHKTFCLINEEQSSFFQRLNYMVKRLSKRGQDEDELWKYGVI